MDTSIVEYYLALLQVQMAILGFVIAGVVTLIQMLNNAKPRRQTRLLIRRRVLVFYTTYLSLLLLFIAVAAWVVTSPEPIARHLGQGFVTFFTSSEVLFASLILSLAGLFGFVGLIYKTRRLLDAEEYLRKYVRVTPATDMRTYMAAIYTTDGIAEPRARKGIKARRGNKRSSLDEYLGAEQQRQEPWDPFQPIREYLKDNAFKMYDSGTAVGLKLFSRLFDKTLAAVAKNPKPEEYYFLARYLSDSALEFFSIFQKTSSEKRKLDTIRLVYAKGELLLQHADNQGLLTIVRCLEQIAKSTDDDDEIIAAVTAIHYLTDSYLALHPKAKWNDIAQTFEEICMSVTRLSEDYYLQRDNPLKTVPIIGHDSGEFRTVTSVLIEFFISYRNLADTYTDIYPVHYFEAIEAVIEALFARLSDFVGNRESTIGRNASYHQLAHALYELYYVFGIDAIEHKKPELLALSMGNLRRVIKPAKNLGLTEERTTITAMFVELAVKGIAELGDVPLKGVRTISVYAVETLKKHGSAEDITAVLTTLRKQKVSMDSDGHKWLLKKLAAIK